MIKKNKEENTIRLGDKTDTLQHRIGLGAFFLFVFNHNSKMIIIACMVCVSKGEVAPPMLQCIFVEGRGQLCGLCFLLTFLLGIEVRLPGLHMLSLLAAPGSEQPEYNGKDGELRELVVKMETAHGTLGEETEHGRLFFFFF